MNPIKQHDVPPLEHWKNKLAEVEGDKREILTPYLAMTLPKKLAYCRMMIRNVSSHTNNERLSFKDEKTK